MSLKTERALVLVARAQAGLLHERDLLAADCRAKELRRRVRSGGWQEVLPRVIAPAGLDVDRDLLEAAAMLWAPAGGLTHHSAARREGIWVPDDERVRISVPFGDPHRSGPKVQVMQTRHPPTWDSDGFLRWAPPARTVVDLAALLDERMLSAVLLSAVRKKKTTAADVAAEAEPLAGRAGLALLSRVVALWTPERESLLEDGLHADVLAVASGLTVQRQYVVRSAAGEFLGRTDSGIPELQTAFEADGFFFHSTDEQLAADQKRDRQFLTAGWSTSRFREGPLGDRQAVRREIAGIIAARRRQIGAA